MTTRKHRKQFKIVKAEMLRTMTALDKMYDAEVHTVSPVLSARIESAETKLRKLFAASTRLANDELLDSNEIEGLIS